MRALACVIVKACHISVLLRLVFILLPGCYYSNPGSEVQAFVVGRPSATVGLSFHYVYGRTPPRGGKTTSYLGRDTSSLECIKGIGSTGADDDANAVPILGHEDISEIISQNLGENKIGDANEEFRLSFPKSATVPVHAPRNINKNVRSRHKYSPIAKAQGLPNDDDNPDRYRFSSHFHICGGTVRGRRLCVPPVYLRPMMHRVKSALFSTLQHMGLFAYGFDCKVIDLFCGSGSVGLEALSYGASHCTFVDLSLQCCKATAINAEHCKFKEKVRIIRADATESVTSPWLHSITDKFDLLIACPPYEEIIYMDLMKQIANTSILKPNSVVVVEYPKEIEYLPWSIENGKLLGYRNRKYGRTVLAIYVYMPSGSLLAGCDKAKDEFVPTTYSRKRLKIEGFLPKPDPNGPLHC